MDMLVRQTIAIPLDAHTYAPKTVHVSLGIEGPRPHSLEARRIKGGIGVFCRTKRNEKKGNLLYRLYVSGIADITVYPTYLVPAEGQLALFAYESVDGRFVIEALGVGILAEAKAAAGKAFRIDGAGFVN
ncbi:MAG TPA: hypothetical protein VFS75_04025 [Candidatus Paceibacterota bacterium]|nr:hypothetical protein [Candidatus Paceibacterota bacterium]